MTEKGNDAEQGKMNAPETDVNYVAFKAPNFWAQNPKMWFTQIESRFVTANVSADNTKYHHVVGALDGDILSHVSDIIEKPPMNNKYLKLKSVLIERLSESEEKKLKKLLRDLELADKKPSYLLREMQQLAADKLSEDLLKSLWLQRLPLQVQAILTTSKDSLSNLAAMADKINEVNEYPTVSAVETTTKCNCSDKKRQDKLEEQVAALTRAVEQLTRHSRNTHRQVSNNRARSFSRSKTRDEGVEREREVCYYHDKFGQQARICKGDWCKMHSSRQQTEN